MPPSLNTTYPVLILKASRDAIHHGSLAVARTLGRLGVPVFAVVPDGYTPLTFSRYVTKTFIWPKWPDDLSSFVDEVLRIGALIDRPAIIIPMDDLSAVFVAENAASLARRFVLPPVPPKLPRRLANKASLHTLCAEIGIPSVRSVVPQSIDDVKTFATASAFPAVVKAAEQWLLLSDRFSTRVVHSPAELFELYGNMSGADCSRTILQEYIAGDDWICHGYYNAQKNICVTFTGRKLRGYPVDAGSTAVGVSVDNEALRRQADRLLKAVAYSGIVDMDWRKDERDGIYKILDCNPRVGQNFRMFKNSADIDVVRAQHLDLTGRGINSAPMIEGRIFTVESFYLFALMRPSRFEAANPNGGGSYPRSRGRELAWWNSDDWVPFFATSLRLFGQIICRSFRRLVNYAVRKSGAGILRI